MNNIRSMSRNPHTRGVVLVTGRLAYLAGVDRPLSIYGADEQVRPLVHEEVGSWED